MRKIILMLILLFPIINSCEVTDPELLELMLEIKNQNELLLKEVQSLQTKSDSLINELKKSAEKQEEVLKKVTDLQAELAKVVSQIGKLTELLNSQDADLETIKSQLADLQKKYEGILIQLEQLQKLSQILAEIEKLKGQLAELDGKYQVILGSLAQNTEQLNALKAQIDALKSQLAENTKKISELTSQLGEQGANIKSILAEMEELKANCAEIKELLKELLSGKSPIPTDGLLAWYPFNGNPKDESGNDNNGTNKGADLTKSRTEGINSAYSFNGTSSYIELGKNSNLTPKTFTIAAWINMNSPITSQNMVLRARFYGYVLGVFPNGKVVGSIFDNSDTGYDISSTSTVNDGKWHLLVLSFANKKLSIYIDGKLENSKATNGDSIFYGLTGIAIGRDADEGSSYFKGRIDDVAIWKRGLTQEEVLKIYYGQGF